MNKSEFESCVKSGLRGHLVGIGGVSMSPLAEVLHNMGVPITGSDMNDSEAVHLQSIGIDVRVSIRSKISTARALSSDGCRRENNVEIAAATERESCF